MLDLLILTELDFRFPIGAPIHGIQAFLTTNQLGVITAILIILIPFHFLQEPYSLNGNNMGRGQFFNWSRVYSILSMALIMHLD